MKKIWLTGFALMFFALTVAATAFATPFVVCDPYPAEASLLDTDPPNPDGFVVVFDTGAAVTVAPFVNTDGRIQLKYDLVSVPKGKHVVKVKASHSVWGESAEVNFTFRAGTPKTATGVNLAK